jgi:predicted acylesterase/phospholipase RssA
MKALRDHGMLGSLNEVVGISAGSLFGLLWVLEYSIEQIEKLSIELDFTRMVNIEPDTALLFPITYGIDDGKGIEEIIVSILKFKGFGPEATFEDIHTRHPLHFRCFATELQTSKIREFSSTKTPKTSIKHALRASMALPFFYTPVKEPNGILLVDGGLLHNLPLVFLNERERNETWGVLFTVGQKSVPAPITDVMEFVRNIYDGATIMKNLIYIERFKDRIICVPADSYNQLGFSEPKEVREGLIGMGYEKTKELLFTHGRVPSRRFSAA